MLHELYISRLPSHFKLNKIVRAFIISETLLWSAWNFVTPIFGIFVITHIKHSSIETAAGAYSVHLIARVVLEMFTGRYLKGSKDEDKLILSVLGMTLISIAYIGFSISNTSILLFGFYIVAGIGFGIASPAKNSLFSTHLDKNKEASEWGLYDAVTFVGVALTTVLGGYIATNYGFSILFLLASFVNLMAIIPYLFFLNLKKIILKNHS